MSGFRIGVDIGGVISKYPAIFNALLDNLHSTYLRPCEIFIITDQHPHGEVLKILNKNGFGWIPSNRVYCADYDKYGNMCKAVLIKELGLDIFIDDFDGYLQWDSSLGPQPILLKVMPDAFKPYWHNEWKCENGEFGRKVYFNERTAS